jgi:plastocyanin
MAWLLTPRLLAAASVSGTVTVDGRPADGSVVYLESTTAVAPPVAPPTPVVMDQRNLEFLPKVLPVVRGTSVEFTNNDDIQHNVFSPSAVADKFDLGAYGPGAVRRVKLDQPGEVLVLCNIHMEMEAHIVVLRDPYFAVANADGTYRIAGVPPGTYTAKVWHGKFLPNGQTVEVPGSDSVALDLRLGK